MSSAKRSNPTTKRANKPKRAKLAQPAEVAFGQAGDVGAIEKGDDELELEEAVFGVSRGGKASVWDNELAVGAGLDEDDEFVETGLERLEDDNLFFVDVPEASTSAFPPSESEAEVGSEVDEARPAASTSKAVVKPRNGRQPVWFDPADQELTVSLADTTRLRKLRDARDENTVSGLEYETRLRRQFEKMHPPPAWATDARRKLAQKKAKNAGTAGRAIGAVIGSDGESDASDEPSGDEDEVDDLFRATTSKTRGRRIRGGLLDKGEIDIDRVRDANQEEASSSAIVEIGFHPRAQVLFSATSDRRLRLFQIDGTTNSLLTTLHVPELPIAAASYHPSGSSILLTGPRPFFMSYDLQSGSVLRSPRGLLTADLSGTSTGGLNHATFSPDGDTLAVGGRRGHVHLVDWGKGGAATGQVVGEVKMNVAVKGVAWQKDGRELLTLGEDAEVYCWDVGERKCVARWRDEGGFGACQIAASGSGFTAVGSTTGIVNIYDPATPTPLHGEERKALKAVGNLTTAVSTMRFNHDAQLLAVASKTNKDALKLVHLPSASVFANWPTQQTPLHHVTAVDFSKRSEYLAVGNARGKVLLYNLKAYSSGKRE